MKLGIWFSAARPKTLWAGVAPVLIGIALAYADGLFHPLAAACALLGSIFIQIGTNFANDYFDWLKGADKHRRHGPTRATQAGLVTPRQMMFATGIAFGAATIAGFYLVFRGGVPILTIGVVSIICGILYTGGPLPLGYLGLGDLFVLIFFGPVAVAGTYYVQAVSVDSFTMDSLPIIAGLAPGLFSVAILTVNNLRDMTTDRKAGKRTLAVRFGRTFARLEYFFAILGGAVIVPAYLVYVHQDHWPALAGCVTFFLALPSISCVFTQKGRKLNDILASTGKLLLIFSVLFGIGWQIT